MLCLQCIGDIVPERAQCSPSAERLWVLLSRCRAHASELARFNSQPTIEASAMPQEQGVGAAWVYLHNKCNEVPLRTAFARCR